MFPPKLRLGAVLVEVDPNGACDVFSPVEIVGLLAPKKLLVGWLGVALLLLLAPNAPKVLMFVLLPNAFVFGCALLPPNALFDGLIRGGD